jgi:Trk K+ transport system NAD-binding subunit
VLQQRGWQPVVVEADRARVQRLRERGLHVVAGDAANPLVLDEANVAQAGVLMLTFPDAVAARLAVDHARRVNPDIQVIVRASSRSERSRLEALPGVQAVMGEFEVAVEMARRALVVRGLGTVESEAVVMEMRRVDRGGDAFADAHAALLVELPVPDGSSAVGCTIATLAVPAGARIVLIRRGPDQVIARGETVIERSDRLLVLSDQGGLEAFERLLRG